MKKTEKKDWTKATDEERFEEVERLRREHWKGYDKNTRIDKTVFRIIKNGKVIKESARKK
jgi:hypothetical protein